MYMYMRVGTHLHVLSPQLGQVYWTDHCKNAKKYLDGQTNEKIASQNNLELPKQILMALQFFFLFHALCMMSPQQLHLNGVSIVMTNLICIHVCMLNKKIRFLQKDKILYMYLFIGTCFKIDSVFI